MKRRIELALAIAIIALVIAVPVLAGYYANLTVTEANGNAYDELGMQVALDVDYLADNGYISSTGLDTRVTLGGTAIPHMLVDDTLLFATDVEAYGSLNLLFETGETALASFPIVVGDGGYVTITDHANLEAGDDFEVEFDGYVDTSENIDLVTKTDAFEIYTDGGDIVAVLGPFTPTFVPNGAGDYTNCDLYGASTNWEAVDDPPASPDDDTTYVYRTGATPAADVYNLEYSSELNDGTVSSVKIYFRFCDQGAGTSYATPILRLSGNEVEGTQQSTGGGWATHSEVLTRPGGGSWTPTDIQNLQAGIKLSESGSDESRCTQVYVEVTYSIFITATGISAGEHIVNVWADGTNFGIDIDGDTKDTATLNGLSTPDNANGWVISNLPYYDYYTHTTSDTLRITYEPDDIISGTTLPNEENPGTYDGTITLGSNPAGVTVSLGGLVSDEQLLPAGGAAQFPTPQDITGETGQSGLTSGLSALVDHPFYPIVSTISENTDIPAGIVWVMGATLVLAFLFVWMIGSEQMMHQMFIGLAGGGWVAFCWHQGIYPFWVIFIYAILVLAIVIGERSPTIS